MRAYFRLDLYFFEHPKVVDLSHPATVLYIASIAYCNRRETDGYVAEPVLRRLIEVNEQDPDSAGHKELAEELCRAKLWERVEGGWEVHDFLEHNESSDERDERRSDDAARKRAARAAAKNRPDGPEPPSGGPSGSVPPDTTNRPRGHNRPSESVHGIAVTEQSDSREKVNTVVALAAPARPDSEDVHAVFNAWRATLPSGSRPRLTEARRDAVKAALHRYPREDVEDAARGWVNDPWPERAQQNDLAQLLHMGSKRKPQNVLEKMRDLWRHPPPAGMGRRTAEMARNAAGLHELVERLGGDGHEHDGGRVGAAGAAPQRELPRPAG